MNEKVLSLFHEGKLESLPVIYFEDKSLKQALEWVCKSMNLIGEWQGASGEMQVGLNTSKLRYKFYNLSDIGYRIEQSYAAKKWIEADKMSKEDVYELLPQFFHSIVHFSKRAKQKVVLEIEDIDSGQFIMKHDEAMMKHCLSLIEVFRSAKVSYDIPELNYRVQTFDLSSIKEMMENPLFFSGALDLAEELLAIDWDLSGSHFLTIAPGEVFVIHEPLYVERVYALFDMIKGKRGQIEIPELQQNLKALSASELFKRLSNVWDEPEDFADDVEDLIFTGEDFIDDMESLVPAKWGTSGNSERMLFEYTTRRFFVRAKAESIAKVEDVLALLEGKKARVHLENQKVVAALPIEKNIAEIKKKFGNFFLTQRLSQLKLLKMEKDVVFQIPPYAKNIYLFKGSPWMLQRVEDLFDLLNKNGGVLHIGDTSKLQVYVSPLKNGKSELGKVINLAAKLQKQLTKRQWLFQHWKTDEDEFALLETEKQHYKKFLEALKNGAY